MSTKKDTDLLGQQKSKHLLTVDKQLKTFLADFF